MCCFGLLVLDVPYVLWRLAVTLTRPMWDGDAKELEYDVVRHVGWSGNAATSCGFMGLEPLEAPARVVSVIALSDEYELLEVRMAELDDVVDIFYIFEAPCYFSGIPKPTGVLEKPRFARFAHKIVHIMVPMQSRCEEAKTSKNMMHLEHPFRQHLAMPEHYDLSPGDVVLLSDLDEIPRAETVELLRNCRWKARQVQLELTDYMYSFEFPTGGLNVRSFAYMYQEPRDVRNFVHGRGSTLVLGNAGWHCSWCMSSLSAIKAKMLGYGHRDRLRWPEYAKFERIRASSCSGADPFGYDLEAYTFSDLLCRFWGVRPLTVNQDLPRLLKAEPERFLFLLPGHCMDRPVEPPADPGLG